MAARFLTAPAVPSAMFDRCRPETLRRLRSVTRQLICFPTSWYTTWASSETEYHRAQQGRMSSAALHFGESASDYSSCTTAEPAICSQPFLDMPTAAQTRPRKHTP